MSDVQILCAHLKSMLKRKSGEYSSSFRALPLLHCARFASRIDEFTHEARGDMSEDDDSASADKDGRHFGGIQQSESDSEMVSS